LPRERPLAIVETTRRYEMAWSDDILAWARENTNFREVLATGPHSQVVVMSIPPGGEIGQEVHPDTDQILVFAQGRGEAVLDGDRSAIGVGRLVHVPAGTVHNILNTGSEDLRLFTIYAPAHHAPGTIHRTKADADAAAEADERPVVTTMSGG
jgi:mannose-6-phosphate isomerase-like protein (cupin superfamily)